MSPPKKRMINPSVTYKQTQTIAQMTAGKRFWRKPKSATVGIAQTKLSDSHEPK
jgi:hypothetical protein